MKTEKAFTLIELLTVIAIIGILAGLMAVLIASARARASNAKAVAECRELIRAWKVYWITYQKWPPGFADQVKMMDADAISILQGNNPQRIVFLEWDPSKPFKDPWGNYYYVDFRKKTIIGNEHYQTVVPVHNKVRYDYE